MHENWDEAQRENWEDIFANTPHSISELIDKDKWVSVKHSPYLTHVVKYVSKGKRILEDGCGMAQWVIYLARLGYDVVGIDYAMETLTCQKQLFPHLRLIGCDVRHLALKNGSFDSVLSWSVVDHCKDGPQSALKEIYRILKPGGLLFITVPCRNLLDRSPLLLMKKKLAKNRTIRKLLGKKPPKTEFFVHEYTRREICSHLRAAGFQIKQVFPMSHEIGFVNPLNWHLAKGSKIFHKNKTGKWDGLTETGNRLCRMLKRISPWITPDVIYCIAIR